MRKSRLVTVTLSLSAVLSACAGGSSNGGNPIPNASVGGVWEGTDPISGLAMVGLADEEGEFHFVRSDAVQYVGTASVSGASVSASFAGYAQLGLTFPDGSRHGTGSLSGLVIERVSIAATTQFRTDAGNSSSGSLSLLFNAIYNTPSSLAAINGSYTALLTGEVISINSNGAVTWQDPATGCVGNGTVSIINATYNAYRVRFDYANCQGPAAVLNGVPFSGLATLKTTANPQQIIAAVTGEAGGTTYSVVFTLNRS